MHGEVLVGGCLQMGMFYVFCDMGSLRRWWMAFLDDYVCSQRRKVRGSPHGVCDDVAFLDGAAMGIARRAAKIPLLCSD